MGFQLTTLTVSPIAYVLLSKGTCVTAGEGKQHRDVPVV